MLWGAGIYPGVIPVGPEASTVDTEVESRKEEVAAEASHLRSALELIGYRVQARDGDVGELDDLAVDLDTWAIRHLVVDTQRWWPGGRAPVDPADVTNVSWHDKTLYLKLMREQVKGLPTSGLLFEAGS